MRRQTCSTCQRPLPVCYCAQLPAPLPNRWPVRILQHPGEARHPLGTARIAALGLQQCALLPAATLAQVDAALRSEPAPVLVYPGDDANLLPTLKQHHAPGGCSLLFLDATWRKSRRMLFEHPALAALPRYQLPPLPASRYRIRREPDAAAFSTLEAIVYGLQCLEAEDFDGSALLAVMDWVVEQQIAFIGEERFRRNYGGR